jgi:hypothetical protein
VRSPNADESDINAVSFVIKKVDSLLRKRHCPRIQADIENRLGDCGLVDHQDKPIGRYTEDMAAEDEHPLGAVVYE